MSDADDWRALNRANWDERVEVHLDGGYDIDALIRGDARLNAIEEAELGSVDGLRLLHLQCHFGRDTLILARKGANVTGLDFSPPAIETARRLATETGLAPRARFVESDLYAARTTLAEPASFDRVYVTWGALNWLPDIAEWASIVAYFLKPGGALYLAEGHPTAFVMDDAARLPNGLPGYAFPYFEKGPIVIESAVDYANVEARLENKRTVVWAHGLGEIVTALCQAGLAIRWLKEHPTITWRMFACLKKVDGQGTDRNKEGEGLYAWPDRPWLPLAFSLWAEKPG